MISDRAGILSRVPELEPLAEDPKVRRAIERGDLHGLYRILFWANLTGRLRAHRETLRLLLARRRLFLLPISSAPALFTLNGFGLTAYGRGDYDPDDGTFILTHYLCLAFIPIFPVRQYLAQAADTGGHSRAWNFIGKVPFGPLTFLWNRLLALVVVASVAFGGFSAWQSSRFHDVHVVNGTGVQVHVTIGGKRADLGPEERQVLTVNVGRQPVEVKGPRWSVIETAEVDVKTGSSVVVFNVLGAAPVMHSEVRYGPQGSKPPDLARRRPQVACGQSTIAYPRVDYAFVDPPQTISLPKHSAGVSRSHLGVPPGGLHTCISYLAGEDQLSAAGALARRVAEATEYAVPLTNNIAAHLIERQAGLAEALGFVELARAAHPEELEMQRLFQHMGVAAGKRDQLIDLYRKLHHEQPDDPDRGYLLARLLPPASARPLLADLVRRFPDHRWIRRALAYTEFQLGNFGAALESWQALRRLAPAAWSEALPEVVRTQVAAGRGMEALREIEASFAPDHPDALSKAALHARVAHAVGRDEGALFGKLDPGAPVEQVLWHRALAGLPVDAALSDKLPANVAGAIGIVRAARSDPAQAAALAVRAPPAALRTLDEETWVLVFAEAVRRDDRAAMRALAPPNTIRDELAHAVRDFVQSGRPAAALEEGPFEWRAAVKLVRSRVRGLGATERSKLLAAARKDDLLHGRITAAIDGWAAPR
jgi:hypothetical protein